MISRRLLRVKVLQALYAYLKSENESVTNAEKELVFSIKKAYDLYISLFLLIIEISRYALRRIDIAREKKVPTHDDLHPNTRFVENRLIKLLQENKFLKTYALNEGLSWANQPELIKSLYNSLTEADFYQEYMNESMESFDLDRRFCIRLLNEHVLFSEEFANSLEEQSIFWNDEVDYIISMAAKSIRKLNEASGPETALLQMYKNKEDEVFAGQLFRKVLVKQKEYEKLIIQFTKNWDFERIAFMDILILMLAIAEIQEFDSVPVKVTFNEYIEISKLYSTEKSSVFINGILDRIIAHLKENKLVVKRGRGLIGEK
jgi:transcription antitermination protein NusB